MRLRAEAEVAGSIDLAFDVWIPDRDKAPGAILLHGASPRGRRLGFNMMVASALRDAGWLVVTPDARGFGDSGQPREVGDPEAWKVRQDFDRLLAYLQAHPKSNGRVVAIGHSMGGSLLVETVDTPLDALVLIGPSRGAARRPISLWERIRFSSDRKMTRLPQTEVLAELNQIYDVRRLASRLTERPLRLPVLLMDGDREGAALIRVLADVAAQTPSVEHVTVPDSHHYCGVYQLPFLDEPVFLRRAVFERCMGVLQRFLATAAAAP